MSNFKLSNKIFTLGLNAAELSVYAYFCSLPSDYPMINGTGVKVKQSTIAQNCGIKATQTVSKIVERLAEKELVMPVERSVKRNGHKGTYFYEVKKLPTSDSFFFVDRSIWGQLNPRQILVYLFICKSYSMQLRDSWNSYNDIAAQTGMKRETIIATINELVSMKLIRKGIRKARNNRRVYVDNHYFLIIYVVGSIKKKCKKIARLHSQCNRTGGVLVTSIKFYLHNSTKIAFCQALQKNFFASRGSPQI